MNNLEADTLWNRRPLYSMSTNTVSRGGHPLTCEALCCRRNRSPLYTSDKRHQKQGCSQRSSLIKYSCLRRHCKHLTTIRRDIPATKNNTQAGTRTLPAAVKHFSVPINRRNCYSSRTVTSRSGIVGLLFSRKSRQVPVEASRTE